MALKPKEDYFKDIFKEFEPLFKEAVELEVQMGNNIAIQDAKNQGTKTRDSGLKVSRKDLNNFVKKFELNVTDANKELSKRISNSILENIQQKGSNKDLAKMIEALFDEDSSSHFNYKKRYETIARTESASILNTSSSNKANSLGATRKYLSTIMDNRRSGICDKMQNKYGTEEEAIPINDLFKVTVAGKEIESLLPPFHPNCRTFVLYSFD